MQWSSQTRLIVSLRCWGHGGRGGDGSGGQPTHKLQGDLRAGKRLGYCFGVCSMHVSYICTKILQQVRKEHSLPPLPPQVC